MKVSDTIGAASGRRIERKLFATVATALEPGEEPLVGFVAQAPGEIKKNVGTIVTVGSANLFNAGVRVGAFAALVTGGTPPDVQGKALRAGLVLTDRAVITVKLNRSAMPKEVGGRVLRDAVIGAAYLDGSYKVAGAEIRSGALFMRDGGIHVFEISLASREKFEAFCQLIDANPGSMG